MSNGREDSDVTRQQEVVRDGDTLYREEKTSIIEQPAGNEPTAVLDLDDEQARLAERERLAQEEVDRAAAEQRAREAEREAERQAAADQRRQALGTVTPAEANVDVEPADIDRLNTERFLPALGFFLLRLVTAGVMAVHGYQHLSNINGTADFFAKFAIPSPGIMAWVVGIGEVLAAIALLFGILVRVAGLGIALLMGGALAMVLWGAQNPFQPNTPGFTGELELVLAAIGVLFAFVGGGGWGIDGGIRRNRARRKAGIV